MSDDHSDPADMTNDGEVELNLPREVVEEQVLPREDIRFFRSFNERRQSAGVETPTRVDLERNRDFPGPGGQLLGDGTQFDSNPYTDVRARHIDPDRWDQQPHANRGGQDLTWSPDAALMDTVARLQRDLDEMRAESRYLRTPGGRDSLRQSRQVTFTSTKVPKFAGVTSWEQYRQVCDAIVLPLHCSCSLIWMGKH